MNQNCWEYKNCGRQPGGAKVGELGVCPASTNDRLDGFHHGKKAGRSCWVITGTYCKGEVQGVFAKKFGNCLNCDFYKLVKEEEYPDFIMTSLLLKALEEKKE